MNEQNPLLSLLIVFVPLSVMAIGGGQSILGDMQREVVVHHGWMTAQAFQEVFAVSRVSPGPGLLIVTLIGWHVSGWLGAVVATAAIVVPSSLLVYALAYVWHSRPPAKWQRALSRGLAPIAAGLIIASVFHLLSQAQGQVVAWVVAIVIGALAIFSRVGQVLLLVGGTALFAVLRLF